MRYQSLGLSYFMSERFWVSSSSPAPQTPSTTWAIGMGINLRGRRRTWPYKVLHRRHSSGFTHRSDCSSRRASGPGHSERFVGYQSLGLSSWTCLFAEVL